MAILNKQEFIEIVNKAPGNIPPEQILAGLKERGHFIEGFDDEQTIRTERSREEATVRLGPVKVGPTFTATGKEGPVEAGAKAVGNLPTSLASNVLRFTLKTPINTARSVFGAGKEGFGLFRDEGLVDGTKFFLQGLRQTVSDVATPVKETIAGIGAKPTQKIIEATTGRKIETDDTRRIDAVGRGIKNYFDSGEAVRDATNDPIKVGSVIMSIVFAGAAATGKLPQLDKAITTVGGKTIEGAKTAAAKAAAGAKAVGRAPGAVGRGVGQVTIGGKSTEAVSQVAKTPKLVKDFQLGRKTSETIARDVRTSLKKFRVESAAKFDKVVAKVPKTPISKVETIAKLKSNMAKEGLSLNAKETRVVGDMFKRINGWKDWNARGVLRLRQQLDRMKLFRPGAEFQNSNRVFNSVRKDLNNIAITKSKALKGALQSASDDVQLGQEIRGTLLGSDASKNVEISSSKIEALVTKIADPTKRDATRALLEKLQGKTGVNVIDQIKSLNAARTLNEPVQGIASPFRTVGQVATKGVSKVAAAKGTVTNKAKEFLSSVKGGLSIEPTKATIGTGAIKEEIAVSASKNGIAKGISDSIVFKSGKILKDSVARTRAADIAGKLDIAFPGKGLGAQFTSQINVSNTTFEELKRVAFKLIEGLI